MKESTIDNLKLLGAILYFVCCIGSVFIISLVIGFTIMLGG